MADNETNADLDDDHDDESNAPKSRYNVSLKSANLCKMKQVRNNLHLQLENVVKMSFLVWTSLCGFVAVLMRNQDVKTTAFNHRMMSLFREFDLCVSLLLLDI